MDAGITAGVFGLVGAASTTIVNVAQVRFRDRRDRSKQVTDLALAEYNAHLTVVKERPGGAVLPISAYAHQTDLMLRALDAGDLSPARIAEIIRSNDAFCRAVVEAQSSKVLTAVIARNIFLFPG
jgi:hypothetical protein